MKTLEQKRAYQRDWHNAAYKKNPNKYREQGRTRRRLHGVSINARRRELAAQRRSAELERRAAQARAELGREPQTLNEWFPTQSRFSEWVQLARAIAVSRRTVLDWRTDKCPPVRAHRRKLFEITRLACFANAANWKPREKPARKMGEETAVPILAELVVRCGLATRELKQIRVSQIEHNGIRLKSGRFIRFGEEWEQVSRNSLEEWLGRAKPTDLVFFSRKPVDRGRPASGVWITRVLRASGVSMHERRTARLRHFAGDFARFSGDKRRFLRHVRNDHKLSKSGSREAWEELRDRKAIARAEGREFSKASPATAYDVLFPANAKKARARGGRPKGMTEERQREAELLLKHLGQFEQEHGSKRGAMPCAARKVYGAVDESHKRIERARKTLRDYARMQRNIGQKPAE